MKRSLSLFLAIMLLASLIAGCSSPKPAASAQEPAAPAQSAENAPAQSAQKGEPVKITYLSRNTNLSDPRASFYIDKLKEFQELNPDIVVEDVSIGDDTDAHKAKVNSLVAAGTPADVFVCSTTFPLQDWVDNGVIHDISPLVESPDWTGPSGDTLERFTFGDGIYGIPNQLITTAVYVNTGLLEEHGFSVPKTWEDIEAMVEPLNAAGIVPFGIGAQSTNEIDRFVNCLAMRMYGLEFRDKIASGEWTWDGPEGMAVLEKIKYFIDNGFFDPDAVSFAVQNGVLPFFEQGKVAMVMSASFNIGLFQVLDFHDKVDVINFPYFADKPENKDIWYSARNEGFVVSSKPGTPEYEASCRLLKFMLSKETFNGLAEVLNGGVLPVDIDFDVSKAEHVMATHMAAYAERSAVTDNIVSYVDSKIPLMVPTNTEVQSMFVGRRPAEVAEVLTELYATNLNP